jgi:hypothetical protein
VEGYHALYLYRYAQLLRDVAGVPIALLDQEGRLDAQGDYGPDWVNAATVPVLDLLNVRYILRDAAIVPYLKSAIAQGSDRFSFQMLDKLRVYENHAALPPVFVVHQIEPMPSEQAAAQTMRSGAFDARKTATLVGAENIPLAAASGPEPINVKRYGPNSIEATVSLTAPGLLVLSEMWYPGWYAQLDGGPAVPTLTADIALQATPVPAGDHTVCFFFRPRSVIMGAIISGFAATLWLGALLVLVLRKKQSPPALG